MPQDRKEVFLKELYYKNYPILIRYGSKLVGDQSLVKDVIQDLFLRFFEKKIDLTEHPAPAAYVVKSYRRELLRAQSRSQINPPEMDIPVVEYSHEDLMIQDETLESQKSRLLNILNTLPTRQREIIWLHYYEELSYQEIAHILNVNYQSVLNNLQRAFKKIRSVYPHGLQNQ